VVNAWAIWTFAWHLKTRTKFSVGRDIFASLDEHLFDDAGFFLLTAGRPKRRLRSEFQLIDSCGPVVVETRASTGCADPAWLECNGQTKTYTGAHALETYCNRNNKSRNGNCGVVCESLGRESNVALLWKNGVRVAKWAMRTYNGAGLLLARLSSLPRWTPQPHPIQCDGFEPRRPHGGAFDSGAFVGSARSP
jgi:hypothetical protein